MGLNKSKGNMYGFITDTWNTVKGRCPHDCSYCYMKKYKNQRPVRFDGKELKTDLGTGNFIFVGSGCDMFAESIPESWIRETLEHCKKFDNRYFYQSKNPSGFIYFNEFPKDSVFCATIESDSFYPEIMKNSPDPMTRSLAMQHISLFAKTHVTVEPIMEFNLEHMLRMIRRCKPEQVNIGADSLGHKLPEPTPEKIRDLIAGLAEFTKVHLKENLKRIYKQPVNF